MKTLIPAAIVATLALAPPEAHAFDMKGIELGAPTTIATLKAAFPIKNCALPANGSGTCRGFDINGPKMPPGTVEVIVQVDAWRVSMIAVAFTSTDYADFRREVLAKYGNPGEIVNFDTQIWRDARGDSVQLMPTVTSDVYGGCYNICGLLVARSAAMNANDAAYRAAHTGAL